MPQAKIRSLFAALALLVMIAFAVPADAAATRIGHAHYDAALGAIVVPYDGPVPRFTQDALSPNHHYIDLRGASLSVQTLQRPGLGGALTRLELADHPELDAVRVVFVGRIPLRPVLRVNRAGHQLLIFPQGRIKAPKQAKPAPKAPAKSAAKTPPVALARPALRGPGVLVVPYGGRAPAWRAYGSGRDSRVVYVEFTGTVIGFSGARQAALRDPAIERWAIARTGDNTLRLSVRFHTQPRLKIDAIPGGLRLQATVPTAPSATPRPTPLTPATPAPEPSLAPRPALTPEPHPSVPQPTPSASSLVLRPLTVVSPKPLPRPRPTPPPVIDTRFARPYFDAGRQVIVWPYVGAAPGYRMVQAAGPSVTVEMPRAALQTPGKLTQPMPGHPLLTRWEAVAAPGGALNLTLDFARSGEAIVALDTAKRQLLIFPQSAGAPAAAAPIRTVFGRVGFDAQLGALVLTYFGQVPAYTVDATAPTQVAVDFLGAAIEPAGVQFEAVRDMPLLSFWLVAPRMPNGVRLSFLMRYPGHVRVQDDAPNHRLLVLPQLGPEPTARP